MTSAFGKVILLGEHAVVYGEPALACAIDRTTTCQATPSDAWQVEGGDAACQEALGRLVDGLDLAPHKVRVTSDIPVGAGLGSSAALAVALARAVLKMSDPTISLEAIEAAAAPLEEVFHGRPSGIDVAVAVRGGTGVFRRDAGFSSLNAPSFPLLVGLSGVPRRTADLVARVRAGWDEDGGATRAHIAALGALTETGTQALMGERWSDLGGTMTQAHTHLRGLGVSSPVLCEMVDDALSAGAHGAKLTGAGGGGAVIALCPDRPETVLSAWSKKGRTGFQVVAG